MFCSKNICGNPKEREDIRNMIEEAKQLHTDNESEDVGNFRFLVVGKGHRRKIIKITHSLTAALDQLRVVASSTSNDPGPRSR